MCGECAAAAAAFSLDIVRGGATFGHTCGVTAVHKRNLIAH
jgi:hypothetical protein